MIPVMIISTEELSLNTNIHSQKKVIECVTNCNLVTRYQLSRLDFTPNLFGVEFRMRQNTDALLLRFRMHMLTFVSSPVFHPSQ